DLRHGRCRAGLGQAGRPLQDGAGLTAKPLVAPQFNCGAHHSGICPSRDPIGEGGSYSARAALGSRKRPTGPIMRRREFIAGLTGAAAWPLAARAQQPKAQVVGLLNGVAFDGPYAVAVAAIRQGLQETGFFQGQNLAIEYRTADGQYERLPDLATDLVRQQVAVIVAIGASTPALRATTAASTVPTVFATGSDAVEVGVAYGLDRPVSVTGTNFGAAELVSRRLEWLLELRPRASLIGYVDNPRLSEAVAANVEHITAAARTSGRARVDFDDSTADES